MIDPDVDLHDPGQRAETAVREWDLVAAISVGGVIGALGRYGIGEAVSHRGDGFAWSTLIVNATGCLLIGVLMVLLLERRSPARPAPRLARPFLGVGVLGGYTTYSTFAVDVQRLLVAHRPLLALAYVAGSVLGCLVAVWTATALTRRIGRP